MVSKMNIIFVSAVSTRMNTSSSIRNVALIDGLLKNGHTITLIEPLPSTDSIFYDNLILEHENLSVVYLNEKYIYSKTAKMNTTSKIKRILRKIIRKIYHRIIIIKGPRYHIKTELLERIKEFDYDTIISSSDPKTSHMVAINILKILKLESIDWIQYWGDPMSIDVTSKCLMPRFYVKLLEKKILKKASKIIYTSPITLEVQRVIFNNLKFKMRYVPTPFSKSISNLKCKKNMIKNKVRTIGYFGNYESSVRNIIPLYSAIRNNYELKLIISGYSDIKLISSDNAEIKPRINREEVKDLEKASDLLIVLLNHKGTQIPGKIFHYAGTDKPILVILDGEYSRLIKRVFDKFGRYYFCNNDTDSIRDAITSIFAENKSFKPLEEFSSEKVAKLFENIIKGN